VLPPPPPPPPFGPDLGQGAATPAGEQESVTRR
jgi:hypothetical protein